MNWDAVGAIAELLGALGVFCSLMYLAIQVRSNSSLIRMQNINEQTSHMQSFADLQARPELQEALRKVYRQNDLVSDQEGVFMESYILSALALARSDYFRFKHGYASADEWDVVKARTLEAFVADWPRKWWAERGSRMFEPDFVAEINTLIGRSTPFRDTISSVASSRERDA